MPVIGDKLYGEDDSLYLEFIEHGWTDRLVRNVEMRRQALHAFKLEFRFPPRISRTFSAPLALDMSEFVMIKMGYSKQDLDEALKNF